jgi:hypothetical protein
MKIFNPVDLGFDLGHIGGIIDDLQLEKFESDKKYPDEKKN